VIAIRMPRFAQLRSGQIGLALLVLLLAVALLGPLFAPHSPDAPIGLPGAGPSASAPLGTDFLGRDVLSRVLHGGLTVIGLSSLATFATYLVGITIGLVAGYSRSLIDPLLMRGVDLLLSVPALLLLLVLVTGAGSSIPVLILGVVLVLSPGVVRLVRTATLEVSVRGYVEAAVARGESTRAILFGEILPNIVRPVVADLGIRYGYSIILIASLNYLNLGIRPPTADWGLMTSENREVITTNPLAVLVPALLLGLLTVSVNLIGDAYARTLGRSEGRR
jgi:peptide/nickel transport system permease protein